MLDIGNILKTTSIMFQKEKLTIGECKDELMVAIGQFTLFPMLMLTETSQTYSGD